METIKPSARRAKMALKHIAEVEWNITESLQQDLREAEGNFILWAVNLGVFESGHSSLDYRLQDVPEATDLIKNLLDDLSEHAERLGQLASDDDSRSSDVTGPAVDQEDCDSDLDSDTDDDFGELDAHVSSLKDIVIRLFSLARSIRNYSTRSAQGRRNIYSTYPSEDRQAIMEHLFNIEKRRTIDYIVDVRKQSRQAEDARAGNTTLASETGTVTSLVSQPGSNNGQLPHLQDEDQHSPPSAQPSGHNSEEKKERTGDPFLDEHDEALIVRFARANSRRRQQFVYWRHRQEASLIATESVQEEEDDLVDLPAKAPAKVGATGVVSPSAQRPAPSMPSSATKLQKDRINLAERASLASDISRPPSARGPEGTLSDWPSAPEGLREGPYFNCPYCYNPCPERYRSDDGWKSHLMHDLKPYCCTYLYCKSGDQLYDSWADWTSHEMLVHNKVWICLEHPDDEYRAPEEYREHVQHAHPVEASLMLSPEILAARTTGSKSSGRDCPFCLARSPYTVDLQKHIAWHLEKIALGALPRSTGLEIDAQGIARSAMAENLGIVDSRADDFDQGCTLLTSRLND